MAKLCILLLLATVLWGCNSNTAEQPGATATAVQQAPKAGSMAQVYTCTMHPEVISDKPGKCPRCQMDLVLKK